MSATIESGTAIRPFQVESAGEQVDDLRRRIAATRWPSKELVADRSQVVQLAATQALAKYWLDEYDFGRVGQRLNALPQFVTEIDGVDIHFIHVNCFDHTRSSGRQPGRVRRLNPCAAGSAT